MSERVFRLFLGGFLLFFLFLGKHSLIYAYIALLFFEGATNLRIPLLVSKVRYGENKHALPVPDSSYRINFEAERALRFVVITLLILPYVFFHETFWFVPWFVGFALLLAGITGTCPMNIFLRWVGFR